MAGQERVMKRVSVLILAVAAVAAAAFMVSGRPSAAAPVPASATASAPIEIMVYKSPTCGCCKKWNDYLTANGFQVTSRDMDDVSPIKTELGVPRKLVSCHTAVVQGYVIEGHVPAADIARLLREKPKVVGLSAPGMPGASPGMDTGSDPYEVLTFDMKGATTVWARH
jgi:hypothetical protein